MLHSRGASLAAVRSLFDDPIGVCEVLGAIGLLIPKTTRCAAICLGLVMLGAAYTHLSSGEGLQVLRPLIFLGALGATWLLCCPARG